MSFTKQANKLFKSARLEKLKEPLYVKSVSDRHDKSRMKKMDVAVTDVIYGIILSVPNEVGQRETRWYNAEGQAYATLLDDRHNIKQLKKEDWYKEVG